jgi:hypothetical protein
MPFHRSRANEELCPDLGIRQTIARKSRNVLLLGGQRASSVILSLPHLFTRRKEFSSCPICEPIRTDFGKLVIGAAQLVPSVNSAVLAP